MRGHGLRCLLAAAGLLCAGCDTLDDPSTVKDLRVLAVLVEPSEVILAGDDPQAEPPIIRLQPLVVDPAGGGRPITVSLRACGNDPFAPSAPGAGTEASGNYPAGGARSTVGSARCPPPDEQGGPPVFTAPAPGPASTHLVFQPTREQLAAAFLTDVFPGHLGRPHGGFDLGLPVTLDLVAQAGDEQATAIKRVIFWAAAIRPDQRPNRNPVIQDVQVFRDRDPVSLEQRGPVQELPPDQPAVVAVGGRLWLEPRGAQAEPYITRVIDRYTDEARVEEVAAETLRFSFYATAGKFVPPETVSERGFGVEATGRIPLEARYDPPPAAELPADGNVDVWIVVRDERGGASWITRKLVVSLQPAP